MHSGSKKKNVNCISRRFKNSHQTPRNKNYNLRNGKHLGQNKSNLQISGDEQQTLRHTTEVIQNKTNRKETISGDLTYVTGIPKGNRKQRKKNI